MAKAARRHWGTCTRWSRWSANRCDEMCRQLPRDAGLQYACTTRERYHDACVHALLSHAPALNRVPG